MNSYFSFLKDQAVPTILVVGCGRVGESLVKAYVNENTPMMAKVYVTDSDKERARRLSEYRLSSITPIRWRYAHDTPDDVDVIVVAVDHDSEHKIIDRLALAERPFISLSDYASVYDSYEDYEDEFKENKVYGVIGAGLVPGIANVLVKHSASKFDKTLDIMVEKQGFVSSSSLAAIKSARREAPLSVRDGILSDSKRSAGSGISWFPSPYNSLECQSVATAVKTLKKSWPNAHNISVRFAEPRLPTFSERVRKLVFKEPLTTTRACVKVEVTGLLNGEIATRIFAVTGDALSMITHMTIQSIVGIFNSTNNNSVLISPEEVVDAKDLLLALHEDKVVINFFDGIPD